MPELNEGVVDFGKALFRSVKASMQKVKDYTHEKLIQFVTNMGNRLIAFFKTMKKKGLMDKYKSRQEIKAIKTLLTNKHVDVAILIFTSIFKLAGGFALEKLVQIPEIFEKILEVLEMIKSGRIEEALKTLFGDLGGAADMVKKFMDYSKDLKKPLGPATLGKWEEFGGRLKEILTLEEN
jgi:hypothetical protein